MKEEERTTLKTYVTETSLLCDSVFKNFMGQKKDKFSQKFYLNLYLPSKKKKQYIENLKLQRSTVEC